MNMLNTVLKSEPTFVMRTHFCGELANVPCDDAMDNKTNDKTKVTVNGWVSVNRDLGGLVFVEVRDRSGMLQLVGDPQKNPAAHAVLSKLRSEDVITATGWLSKRPADTINPQLATGTLELYPDVVGVISTAKTPPFPIEDRSADTSVDEALRLKHRYLDLRRPAMYQNLKLRHQVNQTIRHYLNERGFLECETPILIKTTPEGARDYLVPSRVNVGQCYALPQSPQIFKQLLMVSGVERYYQIARCFRDEDLRADRQPEFTQLDVEMSFVDQDTILTLMEGLLLAVLRAAGKPEATLPVGPFRRMTWHEAMSRYGSDKPDLRFDLPFVELTEVFATSGFSAFKDPVAKGGVVMALRVPGAAEYSRKELDDLQVDARRFGAKGLGYILYTEEGPKSPILKFLSEAEQQAIQNKTGAKTGDAVFFMADAFVPACTVLGRFRLQFAQRHQLINADAHQVLWVVDFPMFERTEEGGLSANHHPFTAPQPQDVHLLETAPEKARSIAYDLVYNGTEIGGGSIRIHQRDLQAKIFTLLGLSQEEATQKFGFLLEAFEYGTPPHGGIALGLDRLCAMLAGADSIREVIAFPKNNMALCPLTQAPSVPAQAQLDELGLMWQPQIES